MLHKLVLCVALFPVVASRLGLDLSATEGVTCSYGYGADHRCVTMGKSRMKLCLRIWHGQTLIGSPIQERLAAKKCREYSKHICCDLDELLRTTFEKNDGGPQGPSVLGGIEAEPKEYPHMAHLGYEAKNKKNKTRVVWGGCGGSLISERYVLTAAHCFRPKTAPSEVKWAAFGEVRIRGSSKTRIKRRVVEWHKPSGYKSDKRTADIMLLKLGSDVSMSPYIRPACLDVVGNPMDTYSVTGWGKTGNNLNDLSSNILQKLTLPHVPVEKCNDSYVGAAGLPSGIESNVMLCAGGEVGKDTCQGDSGGPLQVMLTDPDCMYSIVGITSFSVEGCGSDKPGVYTRVYGYLDWIEGIVWPNQ